MSGGTTLRRNNLTVVAAGLCCSLGYRLDAAVSAMRANMDHFQESGFYASSATRINVAALPDDIFGSARLQRWVNFAVRDCATQLDDPFCLFDTARTAIVLLAASEERPHAGSTDYEALVNAVMHELRAENPAATPVDGADLWHAVSVVKLGRAGLSEGLLRAARLLVQGGAEQVLLIGVDSYLNAADINFYLDQQRLLTRGNSNGFIPGEAAAALLLRADLPAAPGLHVQGVASAMESGRQDGSVPSRGQGLSQAMRDACAKAKIEATDLEFRLSDQNGEHFYSNDAANAVTRVMFGGSKLAHLTTADKIGEVGAATGPAMLAWLHRDMGNSVHSPGSLGMVHLANDDGHRCAVVVRHYGE